jgi:hypothetical protein
VLRLNTLAELLGLSGLLFGGKRYYGFAVGDGIVSVENIP